MSGAMRTSILAGAVVLAMSGLMVLERKGENVPSQEKLTTAELQQKFPEESQRAARLETQGGIVRERIEFTRSVARELIANRITLLEAATRLRDLDHSLAPVQADVYDLVFPTIYPGRSEGERYCHRAIAMVDAELVQQPAEARALVRRLTDELQLELNRSLLQLPH